jgi:hypothetical protein
LHYVSLWHYGNTLCTLKALLEEGHADATINVSDYPLTTAVQLFEGSIEAFNYVIKATKDNYYDVPDNTYAWQSGFSGGPRPTACTRDVFMKNGMSGERALHIDNEAHTLRTLSHAVAVNLLYLASYSLDASDTLFILTQLLAVGGDLHARDGWMATPFDYLCYGMNYLNGIWATILYARDAKHNFAVLLWFKTLHSHGIDLHAYAREEEHLHPNGILISSGLVRVNFNRRFNFVYGTAWNELSLSVEDELIDIPVEQQIPGCWPGYDDKDDREIITDMEPFPSWSVHFKPATGW